MLIRCEKCGEVFPSEAEKCPRCNEPCPAQSELDEEVKARLQKEREAMVNRTWKIGKIAGILLFIAIIFFAAGMITMNASDNMDAIHVGFILAIVGVFSFVLSIILFVAMVREENTFNAKVATLTQSTKPTQEESERRAREFARTSTNTASTTEFIPKCPTCGCTDIEKISMTSRMVGAVAFGIFSSKNGKQFKCKHCGYMW